MGLLNRCSPPVFIYALIFYLSSRPASALPDIAPDIVPHFIEYFLLAYFFIRMVAFTGPVDRKALLIAVPVLLVLAVLDELHQYYVPTRYFQLKDLLVDTAGIAAGIMLRVKTQTKKQNN